MNKRCAAALAMLVAASNGPVCAAPAPIAVSASAYVVERDGGVLWAEQERQHLPIASLAKLMTALLVAEHDRLDDVVTVSAAAAAAPGQRLGLHRGDRIAAADLLTAMLLRSANDACRALAQWQAGSEAAFVRRMNARALELRLADTHFENACGYDAPTQYSSAADLTRLAEAVVADTRLAAIARLARARIHFADGGSVLVNTGNTLLVHLPGATGLKAGYTRRAGYCIVAIAERDGVRVLLVMLNARDGWRGAYTLMEKAFSQAPR